MKLFKIIKCRIKGYLSMLKTGKCGLHLYYTGCGCKDCFRKEVFDRSQIIDHLMDSNL